MKKGAFALTLMLLALTGFAHGAIIYEDPAVLHLGDPANSGAYLYNDKEVLPVSKNVQIYLNSNGVKIDLHDPVLLIIGVPNPVSNFVAPGISYMPPDPANKEGPGGANVYGGNWDETTGYDGYYTALSPEKDVYEFMSLFPIDAASNHFKNWSGAVKQVTGIDVDGFGIFVYTLEQTVFSGQDTIDITFDTWLPQGTMMVGYGQTWEDKKGDTYITGYTTPFTEAGMQNRIPPQEVVPEPSTVVLLGSGLLGLLYAGRRRNRK